MPESCCWRKLLYYVAHTKVNPLSVCDVILHVGGTCGNCVWCNIMQITYFDFLAPPDEILCPRACCCRKIQLEDLSANKMKRITYLTSGMAERRQESHTSDVAVKMTQSHGVHYICQFLYMSCRKPLFILPQNCSKWITFQRVHWKQDSILEGWKRSISTLDSSV